MSKRNSWLIKAFSISGAFAVVVFIAFYIFFSIHQELGLPPAFAWKLGMLALLAGLVATTLYFRLRVEQ